MTTARPERGAALELRALLNKLTELRDEGDRTRYDSDERYAWLVQRPRQRLATHRIVHPPPPRTGELTAPLSDTIRVGYIARHP